MTITITWAVVGKIAVTLMLAYIFGGIGLVCCMDDDSMPNQIARAVFWAIGAALITVVWWVL